MKISEAIYRRGNIEQKIYVSSLDRASYNSKYRGYLFCPEVGCNALLCYVERKKNESSFFRTWSKKEHKEGCPYEVKYDKTGESPYRKAGEHLINLSNKHIDEKLQRTYEQIFINNPRSSEKNIKLTKREIKSRIEEFGIVKFSLVPKLVILAKSRDVKYSGVKSRERWRFSSDLCWKILPDLDEHTLKIMERGLATHFGARP